MPARRPSRARCRARSCHGRRGRGDTVRAGQQLAVMEAMKMEHVVAAERRAWSRRRRWRRRRHGLRGPPLLAFIEEAEVDGGEATREDDGRPRRVRPTSPRSSNRHAVTSTTPARRPSPAAARPGQRTARENIDDLCDPGTFVEYGPLVDRRAAPPPPLEELIASTPADGMVTGIGTVNGDLRRRRARVGAVLRLHRARRHPGPAEPPQEGPHVRARRAVAPAARALRRGRRRPARRHRRRRRRASTSGVHHFASSAGSCRWSASTRAAASPATPRCSAAATSSSPPRTPTSAWAARR